MYTGFCIFANHLDIPTRDVLQAAATKWNFLPFRPGLVGGHCIGVDPYYLTQKAQEVGYNPEIILAGRRINDNMGMYVAGQVIKLMIRKLADFGCNVDVHDPWADPEEVRTEYGLELLPDNPSPDGNNYDAVVLAVAHEEFCALPLRPDARRVVYDIKSVLPEADGRL